MSVKAVLLDAQEHCLLLHRPDSSRHFGGHWDWPGGKIEPGEDFIAGLRREVREEISLEIEITGLAGASEFELPSNRIVLVCMKARHLSGQVRLSEEHDGFVWTALREAANYPLMPGLNDVIADLIRKEDARRVIAPELM